MSTQSTKQRQDWFNLDLSGQGIKGNPLAPELKQEIMERGTKSLVTLLQNQAPTPMPPNSRETIELQEGDSNAGQEKMKLAYNEYKGAFWPRSRSKTMGEKEAKLVDGCATFYKKNKYILLDKQLIDFAAIAINRPDMKTYTNLDNTPDAVPFTNYVPTFKGVIDHIWYSTNALENISLLGQVDPEYMKTVPGFPNFHFPSDHLSLMAEFAVKGVKPKKAITEPDFGPSSRSNDRRRN
ncbi:putative Glucose-repressible alcohol dehydrogenase transcriptional effector [Diplocarpon rosae]|nr:putative Glucose-repressible alcohol dehydrogenase transcriptional effector [Diplocarpon rosae]